MIKKSELRIGNIYQYRDKSYTNFGQIKSGAEIDEMEAEDFEPIQISPEILEKIGFEKSIYDIWVRGSFSLDYWEDNKMYSFSCGEESVIVDYLHQLQNLYFALSGEELTITL